jgi:hypothetical protein
MATLSQNALTLADHAKRIDPDGKTPKIVELLSQTNEILQDMLFIEGNLPTGHRTTIRTGLPTVAWRLLNQGVQPSKSSTAQIDEQCGILEAWSEVDQKVAELNGNTAAFRLSEAQAFIEAMNQEHASTLFYGNSSVSPEEFTGLAIRYSSLSAANAENIISGGGSGSDNTSIWLIVWGANTVHGIFPKGSKAGLEHEDMGLQTVQTSTSIAGTRLRAYQDKWCMNTGLSVRDWRYAVRICNIDVSALILNDGTSADLIDLFYMNRTAMQMLDIQKRTEVKNGGQLSYSEVDGKPVVSFRGIPVRKCDAILDSEATVS